MRKRFIPVLMMKDGILYKSRRFDELAYIGDPINAVRIFNEKEVDEIILLDVSASRAGRGPDLQVIRGFANECFMPLCYGGGVNNIQQIAQLLDLGVEKISLNHVLLKSPQLAREAATRYGSQAVVAAIDYKKSIWGAPVVYDHVARKPTKLKVLDYARQLVDLGVGEILLTSVDRDGTSTGYDIEFLQMFTESIDIPVIVCGGAGKVEDLKAAARQTQAQGIGAGSLFVFHGKHKAVLITYPSEKELYSI